MYTIEKIKKQIAELISKAAGGRAAISEAEIVLPPKEDMGDFAFACFRLSELAKKWQKSLPELASEITDYLNEHKEGTLIKEAISDGPYVNIFLDEGLLAQNVLSEIFKHQEKYGNAKTGRGKKIMVEYSQPNTHKEFHIGHLRNVCLGSELVNLYKASGYKVIAANYIGDIGAHVAKCLWAYFNRQPITNNQQPNRSKGEYLGELYSWATREIEKHQEYKKEVAEIQQKLEAGDKKLTALWKKTRQWSLDEFEKIYQDLGVKFDIVYYESEAERPGKRLVKELLKKGIAGKSQGAVIMDLIPYDLGIFLLLKSDGTSLYATKDLALAKKKFQKYKLEQSIYVVDSRQELYFKQLFKTLELIGFKKPMRHLAYEAVTLKSGAMSSRHGNVVTFRSLEKELVALAREETKKRHQDWSDKKIKATAKKIAYAAMKFDILKHDAGRVMVFDIKEALSFDGFTGPYLEYTIARISSILRKANSGKIGTGADYKLLGKPEEQKLIKELARFPEVLAAAARDFQMSLLPRYLYDLAKSFAEFYHILPVLKAEEETREARLALIQAVKIVLSKGLEILGIEPVEEM